MCINYKILPPSPAPRIFIERRTVYALRSHILRHRWLSQAFDHWSWEETFLPPDRPVDRITCRASPFEALYCHIPETREANENIINLFTSIIHDNHCNKVNSFLTDTSIRWTPRVGPCLSSLPLFQSLRDALRRIHTAGFKGFLLKPLAGCPVSIFSYFLLFFEPIPIFSYF